MKTATNDETVFYDNGGFLVTDKRISTPSGTTIRLSEVLGVQVRPEREGAFTQKCMVPCLFLSICAAGIYLTMPGLKLLAIICVIAAFAWFITHLEGYVYYKLVVQCKNGPVLLATTYGSKQPKEAKALLSSRADAIGTAVAKIQN